MVYIPQRRFPSIDREGDETFADEHAPHILHEQSRGSRFLRWFIAGAVVAGLVFLGFLVMMWKLVTALMR